MEIKFESNPSCTACPLHLSATHPSVPARSHFLHEPPSPTALLIVGEAPGYNEDNQHKCWVGESGVLLQKFINASRLHENADIYLSNACRCRPPQAANVTKGQITKCRFMLANDLAQLLDHYQNVIIFCAGASATSAVCGNLSLSNSFKHQGHTLSLFPKGVYSKLSELHRNRSIPVFFTYHPAILLPGRNPALVHPVADHFSLLARFLHGEYNPNPNKITPYFGYPIPEVIPDTVVIDIETYGVLEGRQQTVFHPMKSKWVDGVDFKDQIVTVGVGYVDPTEPSGFRSCIYSWAKHQSLIRQWFRRLTSKSGTTLLGQNITYDLMYLRMADSTIYSLLSPGSVRLDDTLILSFLWNEQRPERALKALALLFGIADYSGLAVVGSSASAKSDEDPDLIYYNALDLCTTFNLAKLAIQEIIKTYGPDSPKLSDLCSEMRSQVLWDVLSLETSGFCMDTKGVLIAHGQYEQICAEATNKAKEYGVTLSGAGSSKSQLEFMTRAVQDAGLLNDNRLKLTDKKKEISVGIDNINLIKSCVPEDFPHLPVLDAMSTFSSNEKLITTYTRPLLTNPRKGIVNKYGMCYPVWYPIPMIHEAKATSFDDAGGTIQGRFSCKQPPAQTFPPDIQKHVVSRFLDSGRAIHGKITSYDLSQIELRMGGLVSGDPVMLSEYAQGIDRHTVTAQLVFPNSDPKSPSFHDFERQAGKTLNFLVLFRGGDKKYQETLMRDCGIHIELEACTKGIRQFDMRYHYFRDWQDSQIALVKRQGYLILPTGWSRSFGTGPLADTYINEICNFPIQTIAAQLMQSAQYAILCEMHRLRLRSYLCLSIHDALYFDNYNEEEESVIDGLAEKYLTRPPLLPKLENIYNRTVPVLYEKKTYAN